MNNTTKLPQKSSNSQKNPYSATGLSDSIITSPIEALLSSLSVNLARNCQDKPNFVARVSLATAQKPQYSPKNHSD